MRGARRPRAPRATRVRALAGSPPPPARGEDAQGIPTHSHISPPHVACDASESARWFPSSTCSERVSADSGGGRMSRSRRRETRGERGERVTAERVALFHLPPPHGTFGNLRRAREVSGHTPPYQIPATRTTPCPFAPAWLAGRGLACTLQAKRAPTRCGSGRLGQGGVGFGV